MKTRILQGIKKMANTRGYDIKYYHPHFDILLKKLGIKGVIDIGANIGQFATDIHKRLPDASIFSFEPLPDCFADLKKNMDGVGKFQAFNMALGTESGTVEMNKSSFSPSSSLRTMTELHKQAYPKSKDHVKSKVRIERLDDMARNIPLTKPYLVKIDVQGYEDAVIAGGTETLKNAALIEIETSFKTLYEGQPLFDDIYTLLRDLGFSYYGNNGQHWDKTTQDLLYEDSLFVRATQ